jgi:Sec-independent protein translocase protein TatA
MKKRIIALLALLAVVVAALLFGRGRAYEERARQIKARKRENRKEMEGVKAEAKRLKEEKGAAAEELDVLHSKRQAILAEAKRLEAMKIDNAERLRRFNSDPGKW